MKVAVLSDVQANLPPMEAVVEHILDWNPDLVISNGDLVNRGPSSLACLTLFESLREQHDWIALRGNHEDYVLYCSRTESGYGLEASLRQFTDWTVQQLGEEISKLEKWPDHLCFHGPDAPPSWVHITHGTLAGNRHGVLKQSKDSELAERIPAGLAVFVTAHTHRPLIRQLGTTQIINVGSAGSPFDGDKRASYGQLCYHNGAWSTEIIRLPYDRKKAEQDYYDSGFLDEGGPMARLIFEEWRRAQGFMPQWHRYLHDQSINEENDLQ
ncbi:MAG: metallophosphoesterase, partial [Thiothrix sp.]